MKINYNDIKQKLRSIVENRNFFFKNTTRAAAEEYLKGKTLFSGLSELEIVNLESSLGKMFPIEFREYLSIFGKNCGDLFCCGGDIDPYRLIDYQKWSIELIEEQNLESFLPTSSFVFFFHDGYIFYYFDLVEINPAVYMYIEGESGPKKIFNSFADLLINEVERLEIENENGSKTAGYFITVKNNQQIEERPSKNSGIIPRKIGDVFKE